MHSRCWSRSSGCWGQSIRDTLNSMNNLGAALQ